MDRRPCHSNYSCLFFNSTVLTRKILPLQLKQHTCLLVKRTCRRDLSGRTVFHAVNTRTRERNTTLGLVSRSVGAPDDVPTRQHAHIAQLHVLGLAVLQRPSIHYMAPIRPLGKKKRSGIREFQPPGVKTFNGKGDELRCTGDRANCMVTGCVDSIVMCYCRDR